MFIKQFKLFIAEMPRNPPQRIPRTASRHRRPTNVCERRPNHPPPLHLLRLHRDQSKGQERPAVQLRRPRRCATRERRDCGEGRIARGKGSTTQLVREE